MFNNSMTLNALLIYSKKDISFMDSIIHDIDGNTIVYDSESILLETFRDECRRHKAKLVNVYIDVSLPYLYPYQGSRNTYRIDVRNNTRVNMRVSTVLLYATLGNGKSVVVNMLDSRIDSFTIKANDYTILLMDLENNFYISNIRQLNKTDGAKIGTVGAKYPLLFAYNKLNRTPEELWTDLTDDLLKNTHSKEYTDVSQILKLVYNTLGSDIRPVQDNMQLDIVYNMDTKDFIIAKYFPSLSPIWFNVLIELTLQSNNKLKISSILTTDRMFIPNFGTLTVHSPSDLVK